MVPIMDNDRDHIMVIDKDLIWLPITGTYYGK
jgi:hypothetical protein